MFATYCKYHDVHEACQLMDIFVNTENVMLLFLFVSFLSPSVFSPSMFFTWLLTALSVCFFPLLLPLFVHYLCTLLSLFLFLSVNHLYPPHPLLCCSVWGLLSFLSSPLSLSTCRVWGQETSGLSPAVGCGRHGEDARAGLEVCVYVPAGVLQGSGDKGPG